MEHVGAGALDGRPRRVVGQGLRADGTVTLDRAIPRLTLQCEKRLVRTDHPYAGVLLMHAYLDSNGGATSRHAVVTPGIKGGG